MLNFLTLWFVFLVYPVFIIANLGLDNSNFRFTANINLISLGVLFFEIGKDKKKTSKATLL